MKSNKGVISIFLVIIMLSMMIFSCILVDGTRIAMAKTSVNRSLEDSLMATLAQYDVQLKDTYGLFGISEEESNILFQKYLEKNFNIEEVSGLEDFSDLYDFAIEVSSSKGKYNYADTQVIERNIMEYMKYRGPVAMVDFLKEISSSKDNMKDMKKVSSVMLTDIDVKCKINDFTNQLNKLIEEKNNQENIIIYIKEIKLDEITSKLVEEFLNNSENVLRDSTNVDEENKKEADEILNKINEAKQVTEKEKVLESYMEASKRINNLKIKNDELVLIIENLPSKFSELERYKKDLEMKKDEVSDISFKKYIQETIKFIDKVVGDKESVKASLENLKQEIQDMEKHIEDTLAKIDSVLGYRVGEVCVEKNIDKIASILSNSMENENIVYKELEENILGGYYKLAQEKVKKLKNDVDTSKNNIKFDSNNSNILKHKQSELNKELMQKGNDSETKEKLDNIKNELTIQKKCDKEIDKSKSGLLPSNKENYDGEEKKYEVSYKETNSENIKGTFNEGQSIVDGILGDIKQIPNKLYVNEYAMMTFLNYGSHEKWGVEVTDSNMETTLNHEVEYIINGKSSDELNLNQTQMKLLFLRFILNIIHIVTTPQKLSICNTIAASIPVANVITPVIAIGIMVLWSTAESYSDVNRLYGGERVPFIKTDLDWKTDLDGICKDVTSDVVDIGKKEDEVDSSIIKGFDYNDYLRILLLANERKTNAIRIADIIQLNLDKDLSSMYTCIEGEIDVSMKYFFMTNAFMPSEFKTKLGDRHIIKGVKLNVTY